VIPLDLSRRRGRTRHEIEEEVRGIVRNTHFEFVEQGGAIRLLGPDMYYHALDPHLPSALERLSPPASMTGILNYRSRRAAFELCFEDSWSGSFIAEQLARCRDVKDLTIIHLDDHADMLSTLLACGHDETLRDLTAGSLFEPNSPDAWASSIHSGAIGIGCFLVPLFYGKWRTHVRHINNAGPSTARKQWVLRAPISYDLIPTTSFAAVRLSSAPPEDDHGTYTVSSCCEASLDDLPDGQLIVHVDLDYFINDFNGNPRSGDYNPPAALIDDGRRKMKAFFLALRARNVTVNRWIVATSPGFCCACHWDFLLRELASEIAVG
jgi:hypothetical protein